MAGFAKTYAYSYKELNQMLHDTGQADPVSCVDCHDPQTMRLRVTHPGFIQGIQMLAESDAPVPLPAPIELWRAGPKATPYAHNEEASRIEMRSFVCGQCHVEYYCANNMKQTFPWGNGLKVEEAERFWNETTFADGSPFFDYTHKETGARILKAQHPECDLWSQGIYAGQGQVAAIDWRKNKWGDKVRGHLHIQEYQVANSAETAQSRSSSTSHTQVKAATVAGRPRVPAARETICPNSSADISRSRALRTLECTAPSRRAPMAIPSLTSRQVRSSRGPSFPDSPISSQAWPSLG